MMPLKSSVSDAPNCGVTYNCNGKEATAKQSARWQHVSQLKASAFCIW